MQLRYTLIILMCFFFSSSLLFAETNSAPELATQANVQDRITSQQLIDLKVSIDGMKKDLADINKMILATKDSTEINLLTTKREKVRSELNRKVIIFEEIATGGVNIDAFEGNEANKFDLQKELKDIFRPIISEIKSATERPRIIESLKSEKNFIEDRIPIAQNALKSIEKTLANSSSSDLSRELRSLEKDWRKRLKDLEARHQFVAFQLDKKLNPTEDSGTVFLDSLSAFTHGRGLTLVLAIGAIVLTYFILKMIIRLISYLLRKGKTREATLYQRLTRLLSQTIAVIAAFIAGIVVLTIRGDWVIMGLIILFVFGIAWALRESAPKYVSEARLLLNLGPVRESERVMYQGIPWRVEGLNFYTKLVNPALMGGCINIPLEEILGLHSRKFAKDECWFPTKVGDFVLLDDNTYGSVLLQSPEMVQLRITGGPTKTYSISSFLSQNPRNISHGFASIIAFGLDYELQNTVTSVIPEKLKLVLASAIAEKSYGKYVKEINVEFKEAGASSLDLHIVCTFLGEAASDYYSIGRFVQRTIVDTCTSNQWNIPYNQITVHMDS